MTTSSDPESSTPTEPAKKPRSLRLPRRIPGQHSVEAADDAPCHERPFGGRGRRDRLPVGSVVVAGVGVRPADRDPPVAEPPAARRHRRPEGLPGDLLAGCHIDPGHPGIHRRFRPTQHGDDQPGPTAVPRRLLHQPVRTDEEGRSAKTWTSTRCCRTRTPQRYLQAYYTAPFSDWDEAIKFDDARDGSAWSAANARYNDFFREIVTRFEFEDALLFDTRGNVVYTAYKGVDLGTNVFTGPFKGGPPRLGVPGGARLEHRRLRRHHRLRRVRTGRRADRVVHVAGRPAGQGRRRAGPAVPDIQDQPADDDGPALAGIRHGQDGRDVHRRPRRPDAVGFPAVPRGSRGLQARRRRGRHATRCR